MNFASLGLGEPLVRAVADAGYETPTPIQMKAIPHVLTGRDLLGYAQTGTGKTAAFTLPILDRIARNKLVVKSRHVRVLVLAPTRELAAQIEESVRTYSVHSRVSSTVVFGGVGHEKQMNALARGIEILVATPGRLLDLLDRGDVRLDSVDTLVLDEADRMLDMGFIHDIRKVIKLVPTKRQTLLFSATMPTEIRALANTILIDPIEVAANRVAETARTVEQAVFLVEKENKRPLLLHLLEDKALSRLLIFTRTKHGANRIAEGLDKYGIRARAIHGNKSQGARERALAEFKAGTSRVLVATDIAARGLDIDEVTHVLNYELPNEPESYVHRIGRTGRAGATGIAWSFCDREEVEYLADIEREIKERVPVVDDHLFKGTFPGTESLAGRGASRGPSRPSFGGGGGGGGGGRRPASQQRRRR
jgi:ATP-dependent RNA helicase RhlE